MPFSDASNGVDQLGHAIQSLASSRNWEEHSTWEFFPNHYGLEENFVSLSTLAIQWIPEVHKMFNLQSLSTCSPFFSFSNNS